MKLEFAQKEALNQLFEVLHDDPGAAEVMLKLYRENRRAEEAINAVIMLIFIGICNAWLFSVGLRQRGVHFDALLRRTVANLPLWLFTIMTATCPRIPNDSKRIPLG